MKIKKVIELCKKTKHIVIFNDDDNHIQWISDGSAIYPLFNVPTLTEDYICKLYDISDSQRDKISFKIESNLPKDICFEDSDIAETDTQMFDISIILDSGVLVPVMTEEGLMFIQNKYLMPFSDVPKDELRLFTRKDSRGQTVFAVKIGLLLYAIVYPIDVVNDDFVKKITRLYQASTTALSNKKLDEVYCNSQIEFKEFEDVSQDTTRS